MDVTDLQAERKRLTTEKRSLEARMNALGGQMEGLRQQQIGLAADPNANSGAIQVLDRLIEKEKGNIGEGQNNGQRAEIIS